MGLGRNRFATPAALVAMASAWVLAPPAAVAIAAAAADGALSPRLAELAKPAVRTAPPAEQAERLGLASRGPGSLQRAGGGVFVNVRFESGALARLGALEAAGARVASSSRRYQTVTVAADPAGLRPLAAVPGVAAVTESLAPMLNGSAATAAGGEGTCEGGSVISEGYAQLRVDEAREQFGLRGRGTTVGILSDSFDTATEAADDSGPIATHAAQDTASNDLPGPAGTCSDQQVATTVLSDHAGTDEGRAMVQIVHDLAPHAGLAFATAFLSELSFAQSIEALARPVSEGGAGARVLADDVAYFEEPFFQDGPVGAGIAKVTADGATYLTAAGNENILEGENEIGSWEAPGFRDTSCPEAVAAEIKGSNNRCMDFDPGAGADGTFGLTLEGESSVIVDLQWAEPWFGVEADLDAFLLSKGKVVESVESDNIGERPVELMEWENTAATPQQLQLVINRCAGTCNPEADVAAKPRLKFILVEEGPGVSKSEFPESAGGDVVGPTIYGHAGAGSAITLAAVPYNNGSKPESYSSRGPVTHYFEPALGTAPAAALGAPETIAKPDLAATDCGATTFFAGLSGGAWRFCGTSAAAPHAAAVAALMAQGAPAASGDQIRNSLAASAVGVGTSPPEAVGAGLIDALGALEDIGATPSDEDGASTVVPPLLAPAPAPNPLEAVQAPPPPPTAGFKKRPSKVVRTAGRRARVVFRFGSDQAGVTFLCRIDGAPFRACPTRLARSFAVGLHVLRVKAQNAAGLEGAPAVYRFRVKRVS